MEEKRIVVHVTFLIGEEMVREHTKVYDRNTQLDTVMNWVRNKNLTVGPPDPNSTIVTITEESD